MEHMNHHLVLGAASLKDNLLLDLANREMIHRDKNKLTVVAKDISRGIPFFNCLTIYIL